MRGQHRAPASREDECRLASHWAISRNFATIAGIHAVVAKPVGPPRIELIAGGRLRGLGELRGFLPIAAAQLERHQRHPRRLRAGPGRERIPIRLRGIVEPATRAQDLTSDEIGQIEHVRIGAAGRTSVDERQRLIELADPATETTPPASGLPRRSPET